MSDKRVTYHVFELYHLLYRCLKKANQSDHKGGWEALGQQVHAPAGFSEDYIYKKLVKGMLESELRKGKTTTKKAEKYIRPLLQFAATLDTDNFVHIDDFLHLHPLPTGYSCFVVYPTGDEARAGLLAQALKSQGLKPFTNMLAYNKDNFQAILGLTIAAAEHLGTSHGLVMLSDKSFTKATLEGTDTSQMVKGMAMVRQRNDRGNLTVLPCLYGLPERHIDRLATPNDVVVAGTADLPRAALQVRLAFEQAQTDQPANTNQLRTQMLGFAPVWFCADKPTEADTPEVLETGHLQLNKGIVQFWGISTHLVMNPPYTVTSSGESYRHSLYWLKLSFCNRYGRPEAVYFADFVLPQKATQPSFDPRRALRQFFSTANTQ